MEAIIGKAASRAGNAGGAGKKKAGEGRVSPAAAVCWAGGQPDGAQRLSTLRTECEIYDGIISSRSLQPQGGGPETRGMPTVFRPRFVTFFAFFIAAFASADAGVPC
jgi:hypothetical protein